MKKKLYITLLLVLISILDLSAGSVRLTQSAGRGRRSIEVGETFYITIQVNDMETVPEKPTNVPGAKLVYFDRTGQSSSYSSVNGKVTQSFSYTYTATLKATKEGTYSYGPISVGGVKSNTVSYTIGAKDSGSNPASGQNAAQRNVAGNDADDSKPKFIGKGDGNLFMRANVSKTTAYEQEALVYTVKLYTTYDAIKFVGATAAPKFDGFVVEESKDISNSLSYETYNGKSYATAVIARYIIFPQMTGQLKITGNTYTVSVDRREYYHDPFFGNMSYATPLQLNVTPNDLSINVKGLPEPKPAGFSGGVGSFRLTSQLKSSNFKSNQAASIVYTLTGTGNVKYVQLPDLQTLYPPEIEVYSPTTKQNVSVGSSNVSGSVTFDYSFMPLEEGSFRIPDVKLVYFNTATGQYETSVARGYSISVGRGTQSASKGGQKQLKFDSGLQHVDMSQLRTIRTTYVTSFVYWLWFIVPFTALVCVILMYRRYVVSRADMAAFNSKRADKLARRRLKRAYVAMNRGDRDAFYTELLNALWGYLSDKLKMPTSELMRDNIREVLGQRNIPETDVEMMLGLLDETEFARYSSASTETEPANMYKKAISTINQLESDFRTSKSSEIENDESK